MLILRRAAFSSKGMAAQCFLKHNNNHIVCPAGYKVISEKLDAMDQEKLAFLVQIRRPIHVTGVNKDVETGLKAFGAGIAVTGVTGSGELGLFEKFVGSEPGENEADRVGLGIIFGNLLAAIARNPSVTKQAFTNAIMGAAFCESLGLFALAVAFIILS